MYLYIHTYKEYCYNIISQVLFCIYCYKRFELTVFFFQVEQVESSLEDKPRELWFKESDKRIECQSKTLIPNLFDTAFKCISERRKDRPAMGEVCIKYTILPFSQILPPTLI